MATWKELLGEHVIEKQSGDESYREVPINELDNKVIGLYFSAHWCPPCRGFTPVLAEAYRNASASTKDKFDIVFVSSDRDQSAFDEYFKDMPWKALPYSDRATKEKLGKHFSIRGIPTLVILSADGSTLTTDGRAQVQQFGAEAIKSFAEGKQQSGSDD